MNKKRTIRRVILALIIIAYGMMFPPFNSLFNKPVLFLGLPMFMTVLIGDALVLSILMIILYKAEMRYGDEKSSENDKCR